MLKKRLSTSENLAIASRAAKTVITILNDEGWLNDNLGRRDALRFEIESKILNYVEKLPPENLDNNKHKLYVRRRTSTKTFS